MQSLTKFWTVESALSAVSAALAPMKDLSLSRVNGDFPLCNDFMSLTKPGFTFLQKVNARRAIVLNFGRTFLKLKTIKDKTMKINFKKFSKK